MASLELRGEEAWLRLTRSERMWSLSGDIAIPYPSIVAVDVRPPADLARGWFRVGTGVPGRYWAGRFRNVGGPWDFWLVSRADRVLVLTLRDHRYEHIVVELEDVDATAAELRSRT